MTRDNALISLGPHAALGAQWSLIRCNIEDVIGILNLGGVGDCESKLSEFQLGSSGAWALMKIPLALVGLK